MALKTPGMHIAQHAGKKQKRESFQRQQGSLFRKGPFYSVTSAGASGNTCPVPHCLAQNPQTTGDAGKAPGERMSDSQAPAESETQTQGDLEFVLCNRKALQGFRVGYLRETVDVMTVDTS